jgi:hypothetical protein
MINPPFLKTLEFPCFGETRDLISPPFLSIIFDEKLYEEAVPRLSSLLSEYILFVNHLIPPSAADPWALDETESFLATALALIGAM